MKLVKKTKIEKEKEINFLGLPIMQYGKKNNNGVFKKYFKLFPKSFQEQFIQNLKHTGIEFDDVYIVRQRTGESFIFAQIIKQIINANGSQKPLILFCNTFSKDIFNLIEKDLNCLSIESNYKTIGELFPKTKTRLKNSSIFNCLRLDFYKDFYTYAENEYNPNYIKQILKEFNVEESFISEFKAPAYLPEVMESAKAKAKDMNLNLNQFIYIAPEAFSMTPLSNNFWSILHKKITDLGYDVFYNLSPETRFYGLLKQSTNMTIEESLYIATLSKNIIALRSGFIEPLVYSGVPMNVIYTEPIVPIISKELFLKYFSLKSYENNQLISEHILDENMELNLVDLVIKNIKEGKNV